MDVINDNVNFMSFEGYICYLNRVIPGVMKVAKNEKIPT